jgi:hypothetical protein
MPYKSEAQRKYFHANKAKLEAEGVDVDEWDRATKGKKLPKRVKKHKIKSLKKHYMLTTGRTKVGNKIKKHKK